MTHATRRPVTVINGPNLNRLGTREPHIYGSTTHDQLAERCRSLGIELGLEVTVAHSNYEGGIVELIHDAADAGAMIIINGGAYTHTSIAIRDALSLVEKPVVEVHISNVYAREQFRHHSYFSAVVDGVIVGLGIFGYDAALQYLAQTEPTPK